MNGKNSVIRETVSKLCSIIFRQVKQSAVKTHLYLLFAWSSCWGRGWGWEAWLGE